MTSARYQQLRDERARQLNIIDMCVMNSEEQGHKRLEGRDRRDHDAAVAEAARLDALAMDELARTGARGNRAAAWEQYGAGAWEQYGAGAPVARATGSLDGFEPDRNLDALLWATNETVRAGSMSDRGAFMPNQAGAVASVDAPVIRAEGVTIYAPRMSELPQDRRDTVRTFQDTVADMCIFGMLVDKHAKNSADGFQVARGHAQYKDKWSRLMNALDVDTAGEGGTWVPTGIGASMHEKVRAAGKIAPLFTRIDLPTNPWRWPIEGSDSTMYRVAEPTSDTAAKVGASTPGTLGALFDAEIFGGRTVFSRSMDPDSAVAIAPFVRGKLVRAYVDAEERTILDGDTDGTHQDSDVQALGATDVRTSWDGLRKKALAQTTQALTTTTAANILAIRAAMGKWGINPTDCAVIMGISAYYDLLGDDDLLTNDKLGPNATILNGQLGSIYGMPVIVSEWVREDLNASGVFDNITTSKSYNMVVNRGAFALGQRMALDVEIDDSIYRESFQRVAVCFARLDMQHIGEDATDDDVSIGYNLTP